MQSAFQLYGFMHFLVLESGNNSTLKALTPAESIIQDEPGYREPMPRFTLDKNDLKVYFHCPQKHGYNFEKKSFVGYPHLRSSKNPLVADIYHHLQKTVLDSQKDAR